MSNDHHVPPPSEKVRRGEIYYLTGVSSEGSVQDARIGRPAIIVSNDSGNTFSKFVEVVFLTTKEKKPLPTHVSIESTGRASTALCEQVRTVDKMFLDERIGTCTVVEMERIDEALCVSLGLSEVKKEYVETSDVQSWKVEAEKWKVEAEKWKALYEGLIDRLIKTK